MAMLNNQRLTELIDQLMPGGGKPPPCCFFVTHFWGIINHGSCNVIGGMPQVQLVGWTRLDKPLGSGGGMILLHLISCINGLV